MSALSSNNLEKYEYLTGEDLGLKPSTVEQAKFEYSPLGKIFNKGLSKEDRKEGLLKRLENFKDKNEELLNVFNTTNKVPKNKTNNQNKKLKYNSEHSFAKLRNIDDIKKSSLDSMFNIMKVYHKKLTSLNNLVPRTRNSEELKQEVLTNAGSIYNRLYHTYKNKYNKKIKCLNTKNKIKLDYKKLRLADHYNYLSEEEQEQTITGANAFNEQINKKEQEKPMSDAVKFKEWTSKKETDIKREEFLNILALKHLAKCSNTYTKKIIKIKKI